MRSLAGCVEFATVSKLTLASSSADVDVKTTAWSGPWLSRYGPSATRLNVDRGTTWQLGKSPDVWSPVQVIGAVAPVNASVIMLAGLIVCGMSMFEFCMMCPSAPQSSIVGMRDVVSVLIRMDESGGCGGGLHLGGDLAPMENPACRIGWQSSACRRQLDHLEWVVESCHG